MDLESSNGSKFDLFVSGLEVILFQNLQWVKHPAANLELKSQKGQGRHQIERRVFECYEFLYSSCADATNWLLKLTLIFQIFGCYLGLTTQSFAVADAYCRWKKNVSNQKTLNKDFDALLGVSNKGQICSNHQNPLVHVCATAPEIGAAFCGGPFCQSKKKPCAGTSWN